jgi:hypothetical protein
MGLAVGRLFVEETFDPESKTIVSAVLRSCLRGVSGHRLYYILFTDLK